jgi:hypothetical protein
MPSAIIDFTTGALVGGLVLSACWGWLWVVVGGIALARGVAAGRVMAHSLTVGISPLLLAWGVWWIRHDMIASDLAFVSGLFMMPLVLFGLGLRRAADGRRAALHLVEGMRHLKVELLAGHHDCGGCSHQRGADGGGCA